MRLSEHLRPKELSDLVQPRAIIAPLQGMVRERKLMHLLLYGRAGVGKTSAARILIQSLDADAYEINGSLDTGIDTFRHDFDRWAPSCSLIGGPKVCLIDECEKLSANAQAALEGSLKRSAMSRSS